MNNNKLINLPKSGMGNEFEKLSKKWCAKQRM